MPGEPAPGAPSPPRSCSNRRTAPVSLTAQARAFFESVTAGRDQVELWFTPEAFPDMGRVDPATNTSV